MGGDTIGNVIRTPALARDPTFVAILWITGALKVIAGLLALALVRPWGRVIPRWMLLVAGWGPVYSWFSMAGRTWRCVG